MLSTHRAPLLALALGISVAGLAALPAADPPSADAASCVRIIGGVYNPSGNENYMPYLNNEYIVLKNYCSTGKYMTGWRVHDYGRKHTYYFTRGYRIAAYASVKLRSGTGTNTSTSIYWKRTYGAVWNNTSPERSYLRNSYGTLMSSWSPY